MVASKSSKEQTENKEEWDEARMIKYRKMKRKLVDFIAKQKEAQAALDKANRRIQTLEKKLSQKQKAKSNNKNEDAMDISQGEEDEEEEEGDDLKSEQDNAEEDEEEEEDQLDEDEEEAAEPAPKKQRSTRRKRISVPRDENGVVQLPFQIASLNVISLGKIDHERPAFHNERYIFPIGYTVERTYMSTVDPNNQTTYTCKVEDGQEGPLFTITAADAPIELSARTATGVWALVIKKANEVRQRESANAISGPEYYGFSHPLVIEMIEELEGVDKCARYNRRHESTY